MIVFNEIETVIGSCDLITLIMNKNICLCILNKSLKYKWSKFLILESVFFVTLMV